jgi:hypothetical protein
VEENHIPWLTKEIMIYPWSYKLEIGLNFPEIKNLVLQIRKARADRMVIG